MENLKENIWYKAEGFFDDSKWYNYITKLDKKIEYYSLGPNFKDIEFIEESIEEFTENILGSYELIETKYKNLGEILKELF